MAGDNLTYSSAGVDIEEAEKALSSVKDAIQSTHGADVLGGIGGFGGVFAAAFTGMQSPALVSSIDGVGTKTVAAAMAGDYSGIGKDIVNHCVNDILCQGAAPLFFLDYFGCSQLDGKAFNQVVTGAAEACKEVGCALIGGETAEMPGVYHDGEIDVVGCIVGVVDAAKQIPAAGIVDGCVLIGIQSSGLHTNGYSLARRALFDSAGLSVRDQLAGTNMTIGEALLQPHKCYTNAVLPLIQSGDVLAAAHVTGGGIPGNLARVLPEGLTAHIDKRSWTPLPIFNLIQQSAGISDSEMFKAFNMGVGMILVVPQDSSELVLKGLRASGEAAEVIGHLASGSREVLVS